MSYNGTVRCSYCYQKGHNKRSCPTKNKHIKNRYEVAIEQGDYRADTFRQEYEARTGLNIVTGEVLPKSKRKVSKVPCSYCGRQGHTRRTCSFLKSDKKVFAEISKLTRKAVWEQLVNNGVGVGSIVPVRTFQYITGFEWESCHWGSPQLRARHKDVKDIAKHSVYEESNPIDKLVKQAKDAVESKHIPSGLMSACNIFNMPKGWLDFEDKETVKWSYEMFFTKKKGYEKRRHEFRFPNEQARDIIKKLGLTEHYPCMISS